MTDTTTLPDVVVTGQRLQPSAMYFPTKGNNPPGVHQQEVTPEDGTGGGGGWQPDPCSDPVSKVIWNADAAAAAAVAAFVAKSHAVGDNGSLTNREFGANLLRDASGNVTLTYVDAGSPVQPGVIPGVSITSGWTNTNWIGDIHNHPSGIGMPSAGEWYAFQQRVADIISAQPSRAAEMANAAIYIVVGNPPNTQVFAFKRSSDPNQPGELVNPNGQPC